MTKIIISEIKQKPVPVHIRILLFLLIFSFSFDIRDDVGVSFYQLLSTIIFFASSAVLLFELFMKPNRYTYSSNLYNSAFIWWFYVGVTLISALIGGVSVLFYFKTVFPIVIVGIIYLIIIGLINNKYQYTIILKYIFWAAFFSLIFIFINSLITHSSSFLNVRYRIASISIWYVISYSLTYLLFSKNTQKIKAIYALTSGISIIILFYSVTRVNLISFFLILLSIFITYYLHHSEYKLFKLKNILKISLSLFVIIIILLQVPMFSDFIDRWIFRLTAETVKTGAPLTFILRLARMMGQLDSLFSSINTMLFGVGFGQPFQASPALFKTIPYSNIFLEYFTQKQPYPTDYTWMHYLYYNGLIFGGLFIAAILKTMFSSFTLIRRLNQSSTNLKLINIILFVSMMAYLGNSLASNLFEYRFLGVILGCLFPIINYHNDQLKSPRHVYG